MDLVNGLSPAFVKAFPEALAPYSNDTIDIEWHWVNEHGTEAKMTAGMIVKATVRLADLVVAPTTDSYQDSFKSSPQLDIVMIGAHNAPYQANKAELAFIAKQYEGCTAFLAICGGFEAPLQAGIYKGKTATAPRFIIPHLKQTVTDVNWVEKRYEHDGKLWTSGALTNGLDMVVAWGTSVWGNKEDTLLGTLLPLGSWPSRDVDYKDGP
jgi:transcriptional regulator GlxA family with amidase domain